MCVADMFVMRITRIDNLLVCFGLKKNMPEKEIFCKGADKDLLQDSTKRNLYAVAGKEK